MPYLSVLLVVSAPGPSQFSLILWCPLCVYSSLGSVPKSCFSLWDSKHLLDMMARGLQRNAFWVLNSSSVSLLVCGTPLSMQTSSKLLHLEHLPWFFLCYLYCELLDLFVKKKKKINKVLESYCFIRKAHSKHLNPVSVWKVEDTDCVQTDPPVEITLALGILFHCSSEEPVKSNWRTCNLNPNQCTITSVTWEYRSSPFLIKNPYMGSWQSSSNG